MSPTRSACCDEPAAFFRRGVSGQGRRVLGADGLCRYEERMAALAPADLRAWLESGPPRLSGPPTGTARRARSTVPTGRIGPVPRHPVPRHPVPRQPVPRGARSWRAVSAALLCAVSRCGRGLHRPAPRRRRGRGSWRAADRLGAADRWSGALHRRGQPARPGRRRVRAARVRRVGHGDVVRHGRGHRPGRAAGRWSPTGTAPYRTRILVRAPARAADFRGTVLVEWNNVSGGVDADPEFTSTEADLLRQGDAWVGVSAQYIGVEGGPVLVAAPGTDAVVGKGLVNLDPARYGTLSHPGDAYSYDIYTQVARALRDGTGPRRPAPEDGPGRRASRSRPWRSTTYYDAFQPVTHAFDGFLVHSRALGEPARRRGGPVRRPGPLHRGDAARPVPHRRPGAGARRAGRERCHRRPRLGGGAPARQQHLPALEVAGTSHADRYLLSPQIASQVDCGVPMQRRPDAPGGGGGPRRPGALGCRRHAPPRAARLATTGTGTHPGRATERRGDCTRRHPDARRSTSLPRSSPGVPGPSQSLLCLLLGSTKPLTTAQLAATYPSRAGVRAALRGGTWPAPSRPSSCCRPAGPHSWPTRSRRLSRWARAGTASSVRSSSPARAVEVESDVRPPCAGRRRARRRGSGR